MGGNSLSKNLYFKAYNNNAALQQATWRAYFLIFHCSKLKPALFLCISAIVSLLYIERTVELCCKLRLDEAVLYHLFAHCL